MDDKNKNVVPVQQHINLNMSPPVYQKTMFPVDIIETYPSNQGTADLNLTGRGANSKDYAIKTIHDANGYVPASEFFCYELARYLDIPTPDFDLLSLNRHNGKEIAFGSVWEGGVRGISANNDVMDILNGNMKVQHVDVFFGKVFAFDLFINNIDRHFGNYIFRDSINNTRIALAFDFSRAWKVTDPYGFECLSNQCKTIQCHDLLKQCHQYDKVAALETLENISNVPKDVIENIMNGIHDSWMSVQEKSAVLDWWGSKEFHGRITTLKGVL